VESGLKGYRLEILLFAAVLIAASYFFQPFDLDNVSSRFLLVSSIVDHRTLTLDADKDKTIDLSVFGGHYYSSKSIGTAVLGAPVYWVLRHLPPFRDQPPLAAPQRYLVRVITTGLPFAVLAVVLFRLAIQFGATARAAVWMVLAYTFGTIALVHASMFSGHQIAASFSFFGFAVLAYLRKRTNSRQEIGLALAAGFFVGLAVLADYEAMFVAVVLTVYAFSAKLRMRSKLAYLLGGAVCATVLAAYNWRCFGSVLSLSYAHLIPSVREATRQGLFGIGVPKAGILIKLLFSPSRGLLFIMPVLLFSISGFIRMWNHKELRSETWVILAVVAGYLAINAGFYDWGGGATYGPRHLVLMLPFLAVPMIFADLDSKWFLLAFAASAALVAPAMIGMAEMDVSIANPIVEVTVPGISEGCLSDNWGSWLGLQFPWSILPVIALSVVLGWCALRQLTPATQQSKMRWIEKGCVGMWLGVIAVMLVSARTSPQELVSRERAKTHYNLGNAMDRQGKLPAAIGHFERALQLQPDYAKARDNLAVALWQAGKSEEAVGQWEEMVRINPGYATAQYNLGFALQQLGKPEEAIAHYERALQINPDNASAHYNLGVVLAQQGRTQDARAHLEQALRIRPDDADAQSALAQLRNRQ
jgi:Tfp pilus assembly protein PilF